MSSFTRREPVGTALPPGTRRSPSAHALLTISTGIQSLDDVLGGGLPLGHVLVILAPDPYSAYGELLQRYFVAQGLASGQKVCILDDSAMDLAMGCMWTPTSGPEEKPVGDSEQAERSEVKIAWRYENMKQFQTSVSTSQSSDNLYCVPLDLTSRIPETFVNSVITSKQLQCISTSTVSAQGPFEAALLKITEALENSRTEKSSPPLRLCIPTLGSPQWRDAAPTDILRFLHALRAQLRANASSQSTASALVTLPSYISSDEYGGRGWSQKLGWVSDGCITLRSLTSDPTLTSSFPSHHGFVTIHSLPSPYALVPASDKFSRLRGLSTFSSSTIGGGENNLAFKCTRKRFVIETLHLDVEGGVSERRTAAPVPVDIVPVTRKGKPGAAPATEVSVYESGEVPVEEKKPKKRVAFRSDRPEIYDF